MIPPHKTPAKSVGGDTQRDQHIQVITLKGRIAWQRITGYDIRNYVDLAVQRYKRIFGNNMKARALPQQKNRDMDQCFCLGRIKSLRNTG